MKVIYTIVLAIFIMLLITFSLENSSDVKLHYFGYEPIRPIRIYELIFIAFLGGVIFTGLMGIVERFRLTRTINRLNKTIRDLRREVQEIQGNPNSTYNRDGQKNVLPPPSRAGDL